MTPKAPRHWTVALALGLLAGGAAGAPSQAAEQSDLSLKLHIEAQPLREALSEFGRQSGLQVVFVYTDVDPAIMAPDLRGTYSTRTALERLLANTSLVYEFINPRTVAVMRRDERRQRADSTAAALRASGYIRLAQSTAPSLSEGEDARTDQRAAAENLEGLKVEEIVVTGTHIRGASNPTVPFIVIDRQMIEQSGYTTTQELLRSLPQNFPGGQAGATDDGMFGGGSLSGANPTSANGINLRGLGVSSTLVLINGRRMAPSALGTIVDVSLIPLSAVERIEVLPDGSSALYGSDAVGGVVNIILRRDYEGAETSVRYGSVTSGGRDEKTISQIIGGRWSSGNIVATLQYMDQAPLSAADRDFTSGLTAPNELLPDTESYGLALNGAQKLSNAVDLYADALVSRRDVSRDSSLMGPSLQVNNSRARSESMNFAAGARFHIGDWLLDVGSSYNEQNYTQGQIVTTASPPSVQTSNQDVESTVISADALASGSLFDVPAGSLKAAFGISYRKEETSQNLIANGVPTLRAIDRDVMSMFGELSLPLLHALDLSAAVRHDDYSDFGSVTTPRIGVRWSPVSSIDLRAGYGKSFRAPTALELFTTSHSFVVVFPFANPAAPGIVPGFALLGSHASLEPERARTYDVGLRFKPYSAYPLELELNYYAIRYEDRIVTPAVTPLALVNADVYGPLTGSFLSDAEAQQFLDAAQAGGAQFIDSVGSGIANVRSVVDFRQQNASVVHQKGADLAINYTHQLRTGTLSSRISAAYIRTIETRLAEGSSATDLVNTFGNPVRWRGRADVVWSAGAWTVAGAINHTSRYTNNLEPDNPPIGSWTTTDLVVRFRPDGYLNAKWAEATSITLSAQNLFDRDPPFVNAPALVRVNYDPSNANPLGRFVSLELKRSW